jgi:hypothetical protein
MVYGGEAVNESDKKLVTEWLGSAGMIGMKEHTEYRISATNAMT